MKCIEVLLKQANIPDRWNRMYPLEELVKLCDSINAEPRFGEFGASNETQISLERVSHSVISARMDGDKLFATIKILPTPLGNVLSVMDEEGMRISPRMRGFGKGDIDESGVYTVTDFSLTTVDIENGQEDPSKGAI